MNLSTNRIITMDWMDGEHLSEFTAHNTNQEKSNILGQALWDFYMFQIHILKKVHADPHPGNLMLLPAGVIGVIDCGMVGRIDEELREEEGAQTKQGEGGEGDGGAGAAQGAVAPAAVAESATSKPSSS